MDYILEAKNVTKTYGDFTALNSVSLAIPKGSIFGLLGPNGAGKTTLLRIINQISVPTSGQILLDGEPLQQHHVAYIGYLPEERGLYKSMKVGEQALYLAQLKGLSKQQARTRLTYWFEKFGIESWWNKKIEELSKGMAQKIQFIVTVLHEPKFLIFDEPFSGFDPVNANLIKDEILKLRDNGATIVFSTHRMESVEELCDYVALIHHGNKLLDGEITEVKKAYRSNQYEVGIKTSNITELQKELEELYTISPAHFKSLENILKCTIQVDTNNTSNNLLQYLMSKGQVVHFKEVIPSIHDIFIESVTDHA
tara:strand:+ start:576 stop:1505 length:930 start_codon:yes stop_codon:yes gene_type:complete